MYRTDRRVNAPNVAYDSLAASAKAIVLSTRLLVHAEWATPE